MSLKDWGFALLIVFAWGFNFVVIHWGLDGLSPLLLGALRFSLVAFPAILFVPRPKIAWRWLLAYGLTISFGQFAFLFTAMKVGMPAGIASLVLQSQVLFTLLFAAVLLREHWSAHQQDIICYPYHPYPDGNSSAVSERTKPVPEQG
jgi:O-acetylserine/cysteine efflux transporter